ncbi:MAG TPA: aminoglycoside resistance protein, partial [Chloroflexi bacterium]|nr:aminoglycoside resistance protein [Chloroflexota bacterium]
LSYNYVLPARRSDGTEVVLKVGVPNDELRCEIEALRLYAGLGMVQLLADDHERGVLLLERIRPGAPLVELADDEAATRIAATVIRRLLRPAPAEHTFPTIGKWAQGLARLRATFAGSVGPFPKALVEQAEGLFAELLASEGPPMLLHGDLHHWNILTAEREPWLALDPKGVVGEAEFEVAAFMHNPWGTLLAQPNVTALLSRRLNIFSELLGFDRERLRAWSVAQAVLSAWWSYEDHGHPGEFALACADSLTRA